MNTIGNYFIKKETDGVALKENRIEGKKFRFTILTERLVRLEYSPKGVFEDRTSQQVIFRNFPQVKFSFTQTETLIQIVTSYFTLNYDKNKPFLGSKLSPAANLNINLNGTEKIWYYHHPEARNFGGINYSLDDFKGNLKLGKGLYSTDGFATLEDSNSLVLDSHYNYVQRESGNIDLYVFMYRKDLGLCLKDYYQLTGYPVLLPRYAFGNWWNKNEEYHITEINQLLHNFQEEDIPLSVLFLGNKWCNPSDGILFDQQILPQEQLKQLCNHYQVKLAITTNPETPITQESPLYQSIQASNGTMNTAYSLFPLDAKHLNLYSQYAIKTWISAGIDSIYLDYNNKNYKKDLALLNHYVSAMYGLMANKRSVILARNHTFAPQRISIIFTGKTKVDWNTLSILPQYQMSASNNGISYIASPIGGYYGGIETFELYIRYIQFGVFNSLFILSSDGGKYYKREPWRWNVAESEIIKKYLRLRYYLIPYLYTESYLYSKSGSPMIQPLYYKYPKIYDEPLYKNQYFFGSEMLVCPIVKKKNIVMNRVVQRMFIPEGIWYELESGKKYVGNKYYMSFYKDEDYPVFCREGAIIPLSSQTTTALPVNMEILVFPGRDGKYVLYEDDGMSNNYKSGAFSLTEYIFTYTMNHYSLVIQNKSNPGLLPEKRNYKIRFKNTKIPAEVNIQLGTSPFPGKVFNERNDLIIELSNASTSTPLSITCTSESILLNSMERLINDDIQGILEDLEIETILKEKIDAVLFSNLSIRKKRIAIRKLKRAGLEPKFIKMFLNLLEYIKTV